ncbi:MAG TPA: hypothetical protein VHV51_08365 [Polyangiaceae bacterium]|nr:hypothetical protein [Polyangiaceae bacterium]
MLFNPNASFALAERLHSRAGAPLAEVFSFVSGLYFRGKAAYARAFGHTVRGSAAFVMSAGGGLLALDEPVTLARLRGWAEVAIHEHNPHFTAPLIRYASELSQTHDERARFVLLGSVATNKYVAPLREVFAERLLFPLDFVGRGDMSRGSLLLRAAREGRELAYAPVGTAPEPTPTQFDFY